MIKETAVLAFGRMNPPTLGHAKLVEAVLRIAKERNADPIICVSHSEDKKKNPLSYGTKIKFLEEATGGVVYNDREGKIRNIFDMMQVASLSYGNVIVVAGSDRIDEYESKIRQYQGNLYNFSSLEFISSGERDPDSPDAVEAISATQLREMAVNNDFASFRKAIFPGATTVMVESLFNEIRSKLTSLK